MSSYFDRFDRTTTTTPVTTTTTTTTTKTSGSGSTGARACARVCAREEFDEFRPPMSEYEFGMQWLASYYRHCFERRMPPAAECEVSDLLQAGVERELIEAAIDEAMAAPRPSWAYARAVLARCCRQGIKTLADFKRDKGWL